VSWGIVCDLYDSNPIKRNLKLQMIRIGIKWFIASLIMPILVALFQSDFGGLILLFWPSSILLMSLGSDANQISEVAWVWTIAILCNIALYVLIGFLISRFKAYLDVKTRI